MNLQINDRVAFKAGSEVLNTGTIVKGPFEIDKASHYHIEWDKVTPNCYPGAHKIELISPMDSKKYKWQRI